LFWDYFGCLFCLFVVGCWLCVSKGIMGGGGGQNTAGFSSVARTHASAHSGRGTAVAAAAFAAGVAATTILARAAN
jgi:hypothetical protein